MFWAAFGAVFAVGGLQLGLVRQGIPGPGSLPFIVGLVLIGLAVILLIQARAPKAIVSERIFSERQAQKKFGLALAGLIGYGLLLKTVGFTLVTFLFLFFILRFIGRETWIMSLVFSLATALASYALFSALQVNLPAGRLGF